MATSGRRVVLFSRSGRKLSKPESDNLDVITKPGRRPSREETLTHHDTGLQSLEVTRKISRNNSINEAILGQPCIPNNNSRKRKITVYSRPDFIDVNTCVTNKNSTMSSQRDCPTSWKDFVIHYAETFILGALFLLIITVSLYIVFVEGQSLIGKEK